MTRKITWAVFTAAILLAAVASLFAQTEEKTDTLVVAPQAQRLVTAPADSTAKLDAATEVEMQRRFNDLRSELLDRFNDFRSEILDDEAESITWWLATIAILLTLWGLVIAIGGLIGYREFRALRDEARRIVEDN